MKIELTDQQEQQMNALGCVELVDASTKSIFILLAREQYERVRHLLEGSQGDEGEDSSENISPVMLRSQQAFWRDLPTLLEDRTNHDRWVCYHGDQRIGIGSYQELIRECNRIGIPDDEFDSAVIKPRSRPPWEAEVVELGGHAVDET